MDYEQLTTHYLDLAEQMLDEEFGDDRRQWIERVEAELPQIRRVFAWLKEQGDVKRGMSLAYFLQELWFEDQHTAEGLELIQDFLAMADGAERSTTRAMVLDLAGALALNLNRLELARALKTDGVAMLRQLGNRAQLGYALLHLGHLVGYAQGDYDKAENIYREALGIFKDLGDREGIAHATGNLSSVTLELGNYRTAQTLVDHSLRRYSELGSQWDLALAVGNAAGVAAGHGEFARAVRLAAASARHRERIGVSLPEAFENRFRRIEEVALSGLYEPEQATAWADGEAMTLAEAVEYALGNQGSSVRS